MCRDRQGPSGYDYPTCRRCVDRTLGRRERVTEPQIPRGEARSAVDRHLYVVRRFVSGWEYLDPEVPPRLLPLSGSVTQTRRPTTPGTQHPRSSGRVWTRGVSRTTSGEGPLTALPYLKREKNNPILRVSHLEW